MVKKIKINDNILDVLTVEEYNANKNRYDMSNTAVQIDNTVYPVRKKYDYRAGLYDRGCASLFIKSDEDMYDAENIIDFSKSKDIKDMLEKQYELSKAERSILNTVDNVFKVEINENDSPETRALKEAVNLKQIDISKYAHRFGSNYNNDIRLFNSNSITMNKMKTMMECFDMKASIMIEDKNENIPNPIGKKIIIEITSDSED